MTHKQIPIVIAEGDGIGPEIMQATLKILEAAQAPLAITKIEIGEKVYLSGSPTGMDPKAWDVIRASKAFLKAPITTPQGGGFKSLNVTIRTTLGLYANVRPCVSYSPFIVTKHPQMDVVIVRENEEDLYTGIEYRQTQDTYHALKIMTRPGCEKIIRYAFEYARTHGRKKVTCFTKDNILKLSDGLFHKIFDEIAPEYPDIQNEHWIIDIGAAKLADTPEAFDVVVMPNLYGDILSDVAAQIAGSVGIAGSANIGVHGAMFEAIHGSAPRRAGQNVANPSGLILASVMMLVHLGLPEVASTIHNAWLRTIEDGIHTYDIYKEATSKEKVGTQGFAQAVIARLGKKPQTLKEVHYTSPKHVTHERRQKESAAQQKALIGTDVFIAFLGKTEELHTKLRGLVPGGMQLVAIGNRGAKVWPSQVSETFCSDTWRCRFLSKHPGGAVSHEQVIELLRSLSQNHLDFLHVENLYTFNGQAGFPE